MTSTAGATQCRHGRARRLEVVHEECDDHGRDHGHDQETHTTDETGTKAAHPAPCPATRHTDGGATHCRCQEERPGYPVGEREGIEGVWNREVDPTPVEPHDSDPGENDRLDCGSAQQCDSGGASRRERSREKEGKGKQRGEEESKRRQGRQYVKKGTDVRVLMCEVGDKGSHAGRRDAERGYRKSAPERVIRPKEEECCCGCGDGGQPEDAEEEHAVAEGIHAPITLPVRTAGGCDVQADRDGRDHEGGHVPNDNENEL